MELVVPEEGELFHVEGHLRPLYIGQQERVDLKGEDVPLPLDQLEVQAVVPLVALFRPFPDFRLPREPVHRGQPLPLIFKPLVLPHTQIALRRVQPLSIGAGGAGGKLLGNIRALHHDGEQQGLPVPHGGVEGDRRVPLGPGLLDQRARAAQDLLRGLRGLGVHPPAGEPLGELPRDHGVGTGGEEQQGRRDGGNPPVQPPPSPGPALFPALGVRQDAGPFPEIPGGEVKVPGLRALEGALILGKVGVHQSPAQKEVKLRHRCIPPSPGAPSADSGPAGPGRPRRTR